MLYTVYGLHEAGKPDEIRYVGCTRQLPEKRLAEHIAAARGCRPVNRWVARVMAANKRVVCRVLMQTEHQVIARRMEMDLIACFAECQALWNVTDNPLLARLRQCEKNALKEVARQEQEFLREKASADLEASIRIVRAKIADGSLDIQSFLSGQN